MMNAVVLYHLQWRRFQPNWITQCNGITDLEYMTVDEKIKQVVMLGTQSNYRNINTYGGLKTLNYNIKYQK